jgi:hypothetical protein
MPLPPRLLNLKSERAGLLRVSICHLLADGKLSRRRQASLGAATAPHGLLGPAGGTRWRHTRQAAGAAGDGPEDERTRAKYGIRISDRHDRHRCRDPTFGRQPRVSFDRLECEPSRGSGGTTGAGGRRPLMGRGCSSRVAEGLPRLGMAARAVASPRQCGLILQSMQY